MEQASVDIEGPMQRCSGKENQSALHLTPVQRHSVVASAPFSSRNTPNPSGMELAAKLTLLLPLDAGGARTLF